MKLSPYLVIEALIYGIIAIVLTFLAMSLTGCSSTFYGPTGLPLATIRGDYTYSKTAAGAVLITLKHSPVIRASGVATSQAVAAAGTAASAAILAAP